MIMHITSDVLISVQNLPTASLPVTTFCWTVLTETWHQIRCYIIQRKLRESP